MHLLLCCLTEAFCRKIEGLFECECAGGFRVNKLELSEKSRT